MICPTCGMLYAGFAACMYIRRRKVLAEGGDVCGACRGQRLYRRTGEGVHDALKSHLSLGDARYGGGRGSTTALPEAPHLWSYTPHPTTDSEKYCKLRPARNPMDYVAGI